MFDFLGRIELRRPIPFSSPTHPSKRKNLQRSRLVLIEYNSGKSGSSPSRYRRR